MVEQVDSGTPSKWDDPSVPVGDAPPLPYWPLILSVLAWGAWIVFLIVMTVYAVRSRAA